MSPADGYPAAAAVTAWSEPFGMPYHQTDCRGSTFFLVSICVAMAGVLVGQQELDARAAKGRLILVSTMWFTSDVSSVATLTPCRRVSTTLLSDWASIA